MARTSRHSRKGNRKHKSRRVHRSRHVRRTLYRTTRRRARHSGGAAVTGAPLSDSLAGNWSSKMSMGQGGDYLKYHVGQHGGYLSGAPLSEISGNGLPAELRGPAHVAGLDSALRATAGMKDQAGGRRRRHSHRANCKCRMCCSRRKRGSRRSRGGALGYAPTSAPGMLLNASGYQQAGLNPAWRASAEFDAAAARASL